MTKQHRQPASPGDASTDPVPLALPEVSRRSFIKLVGLVLAQTTLEHALPAPGPRLTGLVAAAQPAIPAPAAALLRQAIDALRAQGFPFDADQAGVLALAGHPTVIGITLRDTWLPPRQLGADLALAFDTRAPQHAAVHAIVGRSLAEGVALASTLLRVGAPPRHTHSVYAREADLRTGAPRNLSCHSGHEPGRLGQLVEAGCAPATWHEHTPWVYDHSAGVSWVKVGHGPSGPRYELRYGSSQEYRNTRTCATGMPAGASGWQSETHVVALSELLA